MAPSSYLKSLKPFYVRMVLHGPPGTYLVKTPDFNMGISPKVKIPESEGLFGGRPGL